MLLTLLVRLCKTACMIVLLGSISLGSPPNDKPSQDERPNILIAISDDQSFPHTSFAGCRWVQTPAFDRIAREGIYFSNCYASSPGCAPSRSALVTGRHHWQNEQSGQHSCTWMKKHVPFVDELAANGYFVGRIGKGVWPFRYAKGDSDTGVRQENAAGPDYGTANYNEKNDDRFATGISELDYVQCFKIFLDKNKQDKPFFCWFGAHEPHRKYEKDSWKRMGKKLEEVEVPKFLPDNGVLRGDLLDYAVEIEWFDLQLQRMLEHLESIGELENTVVIVTADNGMPFPRAKANCYDYGMHVPLAIRYPKQIPASQVCKTPVSFIDVAPTILEVTKTTPQKMLPITGKSIWHLMTSDDEAQVEERAVYSGRERHSSSRYLNWGYPQRAIRKGDHVLIWNMKPERWPAGAPQRYTNQKKTKLLNLYGLDENGKFTQRAAFHDIDGSPAKSFLIENHNTVENRSFFELSTKKRPEFELYDVTKDSACIHNLSSKGEYSSIENDLKDLLLAELKRTKDPRVVGPDPEVFDSYKRYAGIRYFPEPEPTSKTEP